MKIVYGAVPLAAAAVLVGCSGFWDAPPGSGNGGGTTTPTTLSSGYFYVLNKTPAEIAGYDISSGTLQQLSGSPYGGLPAGAAPNCIAISPDGKFLYVGTLSGIFVYSIGSNGALSAISTTAGGNISPSEQPAVLAVDPSGTWLIDAYATGISGSNNGLEVNAIPINSNGVLDNGNGRSEQFLNNPFGFTNASLTSNSLAISRAVSGVQQYVFVAAGQAGTVAISFTPGNSNPLATSNIPVFQRLHSPGGAISVAVDPQDRLFYIGETNTGTASGGGLRAFDYSALPATNGTTSLLSSGGTAPNAILPESGGNYVYVANGTGTSAGNISWFSIAASGTSYTLTAGSNVTAGGNPVALAEDSNSNFVLAESSGGNADLSAYFFDTTTAGQLNLTVTANNYPAFTVAAVPASQ